MATALGETVSIDAGVARTEGPGGTRILSETIPGARSVAVGLWVKWGSAHEPPALQGVAHLLEHMVFKATERRTAHAIAAAIEGLGGQLDAYTSREHTLYQARVPAEHLPIAIDVLADLVFHPRLDAADLELERKVVLE
ncbi:MAG: M16 family metallopeptidase, partial [Gemmatimonadota bacterium]